LPKLVGVRGIPRVGRAVRQVQRPAGERREQDLVEEVRVRVRVRV